MDLKGSFFLFTKSRHCTLMQSHLNIRFVLVTLYIWNPF